MSSLQTPACIEWLILRIILNILRGVQRRILNNFDTNVCTFGYYAIWIKICNSLDVEIACEIQCHQNDVHEIDISQQPTWHVDHLNT